MTITKSLRSIFRSPCDDYENHQKTSCIPHNPDASYSPTRRSEILAEVVWWPVTFYLIQCGVGTGQETYMAPSILLRLASSSFLIRNGFLPAEVWMQCSQEPPWYSRGTYLSGCVLGRHISKLQPCAPGFDHVRPLFSVLFHIRFFSRTKIPWTLKSCGFFCFCFLISRYRSLPALG